MRCYAPDPDGGANSAPLDHLVGFRGEEGKGEREEKGIGKGRGGRKEMEVKGKRRGGKEMGTNGGREGKKKK